MANTPTSLSDLISKLQAFVARLEEEGHEVTVGDTKVNATLSTALRDLLEEDDLPVKTLTKVQKLQSKAAGIISKAYQD